MIITKDELAHVTDTLDRCGIRGSDQNTALATTLKLAGPARYDEWLTSLRAIASDTTAQDFHHQITREYGSDAVRVVAALVAHA